MALLKFNNTGIAGLTAAVPKKVIHNYEFTQYFDAENVREVVDKIGVYERRFVDENTTASDLCCAAADSLLNDLQVDRSEIDLLVFISQTPDYRMPATAITLQHRLGLSDSTMAFDVNIGCSGFIYGLSIAYSFIQQGNFRKVLLLDGETRSKVYSPKDRQVAFLFGDAGVAALIEKDEKYGESWFSINSDGSRASLIKIDAGGYRIPSSEETVRERVVDEYGNIRSLEQGYMNGADVFNFLIREVPRDIKTIFEYSGVQKEQLDYFVFHQANRYINGYLTKKLKIDEDKVPYSIDKFGNTSSVSIPLTIATRLQEPLKDKQQILLSGFGVGLSWASAILTMNQCHIGDLVEI